MASYYFNPRPNMNALRRSVLACGVSLFAAGIGRASPPRADAVPPAVEFTAPAQRALASAALAGDLAGIDRAVQAGADVKALGADRFTALWYALGARQKAAFTRLLELGADPNAIDDTGVPLIEWTVGLADVDYLKLALAHGGNPNPAGATGPRQLLINAMAQPPERMELLLAAGTAINRAGPGGMTAVTYAAQTLRMDKVLWLLQHGADPLPRTVTGMDLAASLFNPRWDLDPVQGPYRDQVVALLEQRGMKFDPTALATAKIRNLGEATGAEPPMYLLSDPLNPNPAWVQLHPHWTQDLARHASPQQHPTGL